MNIILTLLSGLFRVVGYVISQWKILLVIAFFLSETGPHIRWEYTYRDVYGQRIFLSCTYLGSRGFITPEFVEKCPVMAILDAGKEGHHE